VLLGAIAGSGVLPIARARFEAAIRAEGKSVEANLRGFAAGLAAARGEPPARPAPGKRAHPQRPGLDAVLARAGELPPAAAPLAAEGVRRLAHYQDAAYAAFYLDRLGRVGAVERSLGGDGALVRETARHLALRMSFEDVIRVAQLKSDPARRARIAREVEAKEGEPLVIIDFFKPGIEELASILPPFLARRLLAAAERRGWRERAYLGMEVRSSSVLGFARLRLLAALRRWRRRSHRFAEEQKAIEAWLERVVAAARLSLPLAMEIVQCAKLVRGYGETHRRGVRNHALIEARLVGPALAGALAPGFAADAIASARTAALADPEGDGLERTLAEIAARRAAA
jgi:indolepyruvate ferredoxin oxidoreductase beta subunit